MKIPITKTWGTLSKDKSIVYIPKFKQIAVVTSQYENWPRDFDTQQPQVIQSEEVKRLIAIIELKDRKYAIEVICGSQQRFGREKQKVIRRNERKTPRIEQKMWRIM